MQRSEKGYFIQISRSKMNKVRERSGRRRQVHVLVRDSKGRIISISCNANLVVKIFLKKSVLAVISILKCIKMFSGTNDADLDGDLVVAHIVPSGDLGARGRWFTGYHVVLHVMLPHTESPIRTVYALGSSPFNIPLP